VLSDYTPCYALGKAEPREQEMCQGLICRQLLVAGLAFDVVYQTTYTRCASIMSMRE